jgi:hypothetical protein
MRGRQAGRQREGIGAAERHWWRRMVGIYMFFRGSLDGEATLLDGAMEGL